MTTTFELPSLYCPIPSVLHPRAGELADATLTWLDGHGLLGGDAEGMAELVEFAARTVPDALPDRAELVAQYTCWAALFRRERFAEGVSSARFLGRVVGFGHVLDAPEVPVLVGDPFADALRDLLRRCRRSVTPLQLRRFTEAVRAWWLGLAAERAGAERGLRPGLAEWMVLRPQCGAAATMGVKVEVSLGPEVPEWELNGPAARAATEAAWTAALVDHDLLAYRRGTEPSALNVVSALLVDTPSLSVPEALAAAADVRDRSLALFLRLRAQLLPLSGPAMRRYLAGVGRAVAGNTEWHLRAGSGAPVRRDDRGVSMEPLAVPTVSWWWEQLDTGAKVPGPRGPFG
ncbi:terpene synthase family protein [Allokutzneria oryzae]|uniref:Terpene synthase n=1 Tax=Allokutzneria oryzae TaxID=1378989 RepID=A0ABV6A911_9PSEU